MTDVSKFYYDVIDDVINGVKDELQEEGVEMQVLDDLRKLWRNKLNETRAFNPELTASSAAQYLALLQRPPPCRPVTLIPKVSMPALASGHQGAPAAVTATTAMVGGQLVLPQATAQVVTSTVGGGGATGLVAMNASLGGPGGHLSTQHQQVGLHQQQHIRSTILSAPSGAMTNPVAIPQLATLPSGLTGHLVQIGQQTYLVPHSSMLSIRPSMAVPACANQQQYAAAAAHLVGPTPGSAGMTLATAPAPAASSVLVIGGEAKSLAGTSGAVPVTAGTTFMPAFQKTQVDGRHDSEDDEDQRLYYASTTGATTPGSSQPTPFHQPPSLGGPLSAAGASGDDAHHHRSRNPSQQRRHVNNQNDDDEDDDDEDDDDFFVPATPGFAPPSVPPLPGGSVPRRGILGVAGGHLGATPLSSGPATPATPLSVGSAQKKSPRRAGRVGQQQQHRFSTTPSKGGKRRRRSGGGDSDSDLDEDDDDYDVEDGHYDVGDDVELMTNATMTPAVDPSADSEEDEEEEVDVGGTPRAPELPKKPKRRGAGLRSPADSLLSPGRSRIAAASATSAEEVRLKRTGQLGANRRPGAATAAVSGETDRGAEEHKEGDGDGEEEEEENEEPLNSGDDVSDEEPEVLFESQNVIVCQYDKIHRSRNRWRFHLRDGIMAIKGRDHIFQKAVGEAEW